MGRGISWKINQGLETLNGLFPCDDVNDDKSEDGAGG